MSSNLKKLKAGRSQVTIEIADDLRKKSEESALKKLGANVKIDGFREGAAPAELIKEKVNPEQLLEETVHQALPSIVEDILKEHGLQPIVTPKVAVESLEPLTLQITFVEKPEVKVKGINKISVEKKEVKADPKDLQRAIDHILKQHEKTVEVDRAAKEGDKVTMDFWGEDESGKEIDGTRMEGHQVVIGSKTLIPGFEDGLVGGKKGEEKDITVTFPEKYHAEHLQNKPATFHITFKTVEEVTVPELNDEFAQSALGTETAKQVTDELEKEILAQEEQFERQRRENELFDAIAKATTVDLAEELVEEETRELLLEWKKQLERQNMTLEQWMQHSGKKAEELQEELQKQAKDRVTLRLGMEAVVKEKDVDVSDDEMTTIVQELLAPLTDEEKKQYGPAYTKGQRAYEQLKWQKKVEKVVEELLA